MTIYPLSHPRGIVIFKIPTRTEVRALMWTPSVAIATIVGATLSFLGVLALVGMLAVRGQSTELAILTLAVPLVTGLALILKRLATTDARTKAIAHATGATSDPAPPTAR